MPSSELVQSVVQVARAAGARIMDVYRTEFAVRRKADGTPVTDADYAAHATLEQGLSKLLPGCPLVSEEAMLPPFAARRQWDAYWLVDPLDGTRGFVHHNDQFAVSIALIERHRVALGVVYIPVHDVCYFAWRGGGAARSVRGAAPVRLSTRTPAIQPFTFATSGARRSGLTHALIDGFDDARIVRMSSCIKSCLVAAGEADAYPGFSPTSEWDTAAAQCVVEEAGGHVFDIATMAPLAYNTKQSVENPRFLVVGDAAWNWAREVCRARSSARLSTQRREVAEPQRDQM